MAENVKHSYKGIYSRELGSSWSKQASIGLTNGGFWDLPVCVKSNKLAWASLTDNGGGHLK